VSLNSSSGSACQPGNDIALELSQTFKVICRSLGELEWEALGVYRDTRHGALKVSCEFSEMGKSGQGNWKVKVG
jgi:hypothetical protein